MEVPMLNRTAQLNMLEALQAEQPASDRAEEMMLYGQFIGSWDGRLTSQKFKVNEIAEVIFNDTNEPWVESTLEIHFGWALQGRIIQDVWISPSPHAEHSVKQFVMYGTTLRVYDPEHDCWFITFIDPFTRQSYHRQVARKIGNDIVQEQRSPDGKLVHWVFTAITSDSFEWLWRESRDNGKTWKEYAHFYLNRRVEDA
jgi:hypothetical protein